MTAVPHPSPHRARVNLIALIGGAAAPPVFWLGQLMLGYGVSALTCYRGDHPATIAATEPVVSGFLAFDGIAVAVTLAAGALSYANWRALRNEKQGGHRHMLEIGEGRARFLAMWGVLSSACFFIAIVFNTIASLMVPPCIH